MKSRLVSALLAAALAAPTFAFAQDESADAPRQLAQVMTWQVDAAQIGEWETAVKKVVEAAETANLGMDRGWFFYQMTPTRYTLVFPVPDMAYFDDPDQWMRSFQGTEGEAILQEAFAMISGVDHRVIVNEMLEVKDDWSYTPEGYAPTGEGFAHVEQMWLRPGQQQAFDAVVKEYMAFFASIGYPYQVMGHEVHFGAKSDRVDFVIFADDRSKFYGENSFNALAEAAGESGTMQELFSRLTPTIVDWDHKEADYRADLSYWPIDDMASN